MHLDLMRDQARMFPEVERKAEIRTIRIWYCKYKSLQALSLFENLEEIAIAAYPDKSLQVLGSLRKLSYLSILHMPNITDLEPLSGLALETLSLSTSPAWDANGKCTIVRSLVPLTGLTSLKHLELFGVCPADKSLTALERLKTLESARFSQYPLREVERYYRETGVANRFNPKPSFPTGA